MTKDQRERALEALGRVGGWVRDSAGRLMPPNAAAALRDLATIRAALEPSAVDKLVRMDNFAGMSQGRGTTKSYTIWWWDNRRNISGPDPETAARKALEEVER